jgi:1-deoxy-D-xylulose-5-phosphate synthase
MQNMIVTGLTHNGPSAMRYPRGNGIGVPMQDEDWEALPIGKAEVLREGKDILLLAYGSMVYPSLQVAELLNEHGISATVVNARFAKPLDTELILPLVEKIGKVVTLEEGCLMGGFGSAVLEAVNDANIMVPLYRVGVPDVLVEHASPEQSFNTLGLSSGQICDRILQQFAFNTENKESAVIK